MPYDPGLEARQAGGLEAPEPRPAPRRSPRAPSDAMLDLLAFDLDGTLADTETLKAQSYGWAAHRLRPDLDPADVEAAYVPYVGRGREEIAEGLLHELGLEAAARAHDPSVEPWRSFVGLRLERYRAMLEDAALVRGAAIAEAVALARDGRRFARALAVVTTTDRANAHPVLRALGLEGHFDAVVTSDDVEAHKPDPCGYDLALERVGAAAGRSATVEDSPAGIEAGLRAGLAVLAVPSGYTRDGVRALVEAGRLPAASVLQPAGLEAAARRLAGAA